MKLAESLELAMAGVALTGCDQAAATLAGAYAEEIDNGGELAKLGPGLLATLESLGMTPRARRNAMKGAGNVSNPLDELRQRRAERATG